MNGLNANGSNGINDITLAGALTREPELSYTPNGTPILRATIAGEERVITSNGEVKRLPFYQAIKIIGLQAEDLSDLKPGAGLLVGANLSFSSWDDTAGERRSRLEVVAGRVLETVAGKHVIDSQGGVRALEGVNDVRLSGNLTRDPELRRTGNDVAVMNLGVAVHETYRQRGQDVERTHFVEVTLWGAMAEQHMNLKRGAGVFVTGRLINDSWSDRDGQKRYSLKVEAQHVEELVRRAPRPLVLALPAPLPEAETVASPDKPLPRTPVSRVPVQAGRNRTVQARAA
jgi:single-strand DNA-binding protein